MIKLETSQKILFLEAVQDFGGATISTIELAERLSKDHEVTILDFYGSCNPFVEDTIRRNIDLKFVDKRSTPKIINTSNKLPVKALNFFLFLPHWLMLRKKIIKIVDEIKPDYVIINNFKTLSALFFFPEKTFKTLFFARGWFISGQISRIERAMLKSMVDKFLCVSQATKHALYSGGITNLENLYVVQNAINESTISKEKAVVIKGEKTKVILHAAGFLKDKGHLVSLKAAKLMKERGLDFKLILAGLVYKGSESGPFHKYINQKVIEYGLENYVDIVTNKFNVISYFQACDILIHPSETEGLPRVIMEAMILKKPVIANAVGGVTDYVLNGFTGFLPHHNSHIEYVNYIEALINDDELYFHIANNGYNLIKGTYTEQNQLNSLSNIFEGR